MHIWVNDKYKNEDEKKIFVIIHFSYIRYDNENIKIFILIKWLKN